MLKLICVSLLSTGIAAFAIDGCATAGGSIFFSSKTIIGNSVIVIRPKIRLADGNYALILADSNGNDSALCHFLDLGDAIESQVAFPKEKLLQEGYSGAVKISSEGGIEKFVLVKNLVQQELVESVVCQKDKKTD